MATLQEWLFSAKITNTIELLDGWIVDWFNISKGSLQTKWIHKVKSAPWAKQGARTYPGPHNVKP